MVNWSETRRQSWSTLTLGLDVGIVLKDYLNVVWCWPLLIVVSVVQRCSAPEGSKMACLGQKVARAAKLRRKNPRRKPM